MNTTYNAAITANMTALADLLAQAQTIAQESASYMQNGSPSAAIGTFLQLEETLKAATALYTAAIVLHRQ